MKILKLTAALTALLLAGGCGMDAVERTDQESVPVAIETTEPLTTSAAKTPAVTTEAEKTTAVTKPVTTTAAVPATTAAATAAPPKTAAAAQPAAPANQTADQQTVQQANDVTDYVYVEQNETPVQDQPAAQPAQPSNNQPAPAKPDRSGLTPEEMLATMSLREKVCQMFIVAPESFAGSTVQWWNDQWYRMKYADYPVGGFILFSANISYSDQLRSLTGSLQSSAKGRGIGAFIAVDEEGGSITRVCYKLGTTAVNSMAWFGANSNAGQVRAAGDTIGSSRPC